MAELQIGISGMNVAQKAIEIIGNNIANASTEGYHRQDIRVVPLESSTTGAVRIGAGAEVIGVRRIMDQFLERELLRQQSPLGQADQELTVLQVLENTLGEMGSQGLSKAIDDFFNALRELAAQPGSPALREQAIWTGDAMASQFRNIAAAIDRLESNVRQEASGTATRINALTSEIADLNHRIRQLSLNGSTDPNLLDRRDQALMELAQLADIQTVQGDQDTVTVYAWGTQVVTTSGAQRLTVGKDSGGRWAVSIEGSGVYASNVQGGRLAGLLALANDALPGFQGQLDTLAQGILRQINALHVQGIGSNGSFTELSGEPINAGATLADWDPPISDGAIYVRVTDTATGEARQYKVAVDASADTLTDVAAALAAEPGLSGTAIADGRLRIVADPGYKFDFLPVLPETPATQAISGTSTPTISGFYTGTTNETFTATVVGGGEVGADTGITLRVTNGAGELVTTVNLGQGYAAGDSADLGRGIRAAFSRGTLADGDQFTIDAIARTDTSGVLAAAGINVFFHGTDAGSIAVADGLLQSHALLASALDVSGTGNLNAVRMADLAGASLEEFGGETPADYYRQFVTGVGEAVASRQSRCDGLNYVIQQLQSRRDDASGVDVNEEAAGLLMFERMFQAMAKYISVLEKTRGYLMDAI